MTPEQIAKLRSELDVVQTNVQVFGEMLVTLQPGDEHPQDLDLLLVNNIYFYLELADFIHKDTFENKRENFRFYQCFSVQKNIL